MKPEPSLLYPLGLIILSLLSFLCWNYQYQNYLRQKSHNVLEVTYWNPRNGNCTLNSMRYQNRIFMKITLDGSANDKIKIEYAQRAIRELLHQQGVSRGIEFTLMDNAKYSSLVALFNICLVEDARWYLNYRDKFWVFNFQPMVRKSENIFY